MSKREAIARYNLIIKKLRHPASFVEILDYLEEASDLEGYNYSISKRTFQRDLEDIRSLYGIDIIYNFSQQKYEIDPEGQAFSERMLEAFDILHALNLSDRLENYIHFDKRQPLGTEYLSGLLHAIRHRFRIRFSYQKFVDDEMTSRLVEPYALKDFRHRWYVLVKDMKDNRRKSFALDRLSDLEITKQRFQFPEDFDVNQHFKYCFGIFNPRDLKPEEIELSFEPSQGKYIKTLPLHESQQILIDNDSELRIKLQVFITHDFLMELLSYGATVKVIKPQSLIQDLKSTYQAALGQYD